MRVHALAPADRADVLNKPVPNSATARQLVLEAIDALDPEKVGYGDKVPGQASARMFEECLVIARQALLSDACVLRSTCSV